MTPKYLLIVFCSLFSLFCALIKQLYDSHYYPRNFYSFIVDVLLSAISGVIAAFLLAEYIGNELTLIGLSGLGGMVGLSGLKSLMKLRLGKKLQIQFVEDQDDDNELDRESAFGLSMEKAEERRESEKIKQTENKKE